MFKARKAFEKLDGKTFESFDKLRTELVKMRAQHRKDLSPGTGPDALYELAVLNKWIHTTG